MYCDFIDESEKRHIETPADEEQLTIECKIFLQIELILSDDRGVLFCDAVDFAARVDYHFLDLYDFDQLPIVFGFELRQFCLEVGAVEGELL